tara:strand:- start:106 stop:591 length:486 start_codon:yes stop_codon:yes gene_type:complete
MSIPQDLSMQAAEIGAGMDEAQAQGMQMMIPQGQFSSQAMKALLAEVNAFMQRMNQPPLEIEAVDMQSFPQQLVQVVMAIMAIAEQAGVSVDMSLSEVESDQDVARLVALIKRAVSDKKFIDFLEAAEKQAEPVEEVAMEEQVETPEGGEMTDEELFASRM